MSTQPSKSEFWILVFTPNNLKHTLSKNGKIVSLSYKNWYPNISGADGYISIRKNETYTEIARMDISEGSQREYTTTPTGSLTFSAGDWLSCYVSGGSLSKPMINVEIEWV